MTTARFRFYAELNDFLAPAHRGREFEHGCAREATVKQAIEALGVPHTEVELLLVDGRSVDFGHRMRDGDRVAAYPAFTALAVASLARLRSVPPDEPRFVADAHLGGLARLLRMAGFDTRYDNGFDDDEIRRLAAAEQRVILTRDRELLKARCVEHGCYVHALDVDAQFREVAGRLRLAAAARPFTRCLRCNAPLAPVDKAAVLARLPAAVAERHDRFQACPGCGRVFWPGGHWARMGARLGELLPHAPR